MKKSNYLSNFWKFTFRKGYILVITTALAVGAGWLYFKSQKITPIYTVSVHVAYQGKDELIKSFPEVAKTNITMHEAHRKVQSLCTKKEFYEALTFNVIPQTKIVVISAKHSDAKVAQEILIAAKDVSAVKFHEAFGLNKNVLKAISKPEVKTDNRSVGYKKTLAFASLIGLSAGLAIVWFMYDSKVNKGK